MPPQRTAFRKVGHRSPSPTHPTPRHGEVGHPSDFARRWSEHPRDGACGYLCGRMTAERQHRAMTRRSMNNRTFNPRLPFTRKQALANGISRRELEGPAYRAIFWGVSVLADVPDTDTIRWLAALLLCPSGATLSHHSAATLFGGIVPDDGVHVSVRGPSRPKVVRITAHRRRGPVATTRHRDVPTTSAAQTFLDLARVLDLPDLVVLGDSLVKAACVSPEALIEATAHAPRGRAARAARLIRAGVESPMESRLRVLLVLAGLPEPTVQHPIRDASGRARYRLDLAYPDAKIAIEYDGRHHIERQDQWSADLSRREELEADGWRVIVVTGSDYYKVPDQVATRVWEALRARGVCARAPRRQGSLLSRSATARRLA